MNIGAVIRELRERKGYAITDLSMEARISSMTLWGLENGKRDCRLKTLAKIAKALNTPVSSLVAMAEHKTLMINYKA